MCDHRHRRAGFGRPQQVVVINTNTSTNRVVQKYGDRVLREVPGAGSEPDLTTAATRRGIRLGLMNCHSSRNKADLVADHIISNDLDLLALMETWLKPADCRRQGCKDHWGPDSCRLLFPECPQVEKKAMEVVGGCSLQVWFQG